ncbi:MAG: ParB/RepB/Spo0J family partition protein [Clostridiales bacterium]|nr:ParB/RepB/Spo0J family partition protein [Clostridiales bacterium]
MKQPAKCKSGGQILLIPQEEIVPNRSQPRKRFDCDELEGLADSIRLNGIIQPLSVRLRDDGKYELIAGERRLLAARTVGLTCIPCILMKADDELSAVYALIENLQRQSLGFFEEAEAIAALIKNYGLSQEEVALRLGKAQPTVSNKLRLLKLPKDVRYEIVRSDLTERHARALLKLENEAQLKRALSIIVERHLNVGETERLVMQMLKNGVKPKKPPLKLFKDLRIFVNTLNHAVDVMRKSGIEADSVKSETEEYIEYVVRIPKNTGYVVRAKNRGA